jgi:hypothetical protein
MTRKSTDVRGRDSGRYDPMSDTWLALIAHAGAAMRRLDVGIRLVGFAATTMKDLEGDARRVGSPSAARRSSAVNNNAGDHSGIKEDPTNAREVDRLVLFLNPVDKPHAGSKQVGGP